MPETIYPKGIIVFPPHSNAPDFVKASVKIALNDLVTFCKNNPNLLDDYKGTKQLPLQLLEGDKGLYFKVDTFKPERQEQAPPSNDDDEPLPF